MTSTELVSRAAALIISFPESDHGPYGLFANGKKLRCRPLRMRKQGDIFIMRFTKKESESGLLSSDWNRLEDTLRKLQKEGVL